eukprot:ANDGO_07192.mRNA.1 hypothetical protein
MWITASHCHRILQATCCRMKETNTETGFLPFRERQHLAKFNLGDNVLAGGTQSHQNFDSIQIVYSEQFHTVFEMQNVEWQTGTRVATLA